MNKNIESLIASLDRFIAGRDRSIQSAEEIEGQMLELFSEDHEFEDALHYLSLYQPGGGEYLYDQKAILPVLQQARHVATRRLGRLNY